MNPNFVIQHNGTYKSDTIFLKTHRSPEESGSSSDVDGIEYGSEHVKVFTNFLKNEYKEKSVEEIFSMADIDVKVSFSVIRFSFTKDPIYIFDLNSVFP